MGYDKELLNFLRNGTNEDMAIDILGSLRTLQEAYQMNQNNAKLIRLLANQDGGQQAERNITMTEREVTTRDIIRERGGRKHGREVDMRYMRTMRNLRDKLRSAYLCNKRHCPTLKERLHRHKLEQHSSAKSTCNPECESEAICIEKTSHIATSPSSRQQLSRSVTDLNSKQSIETECLECHVSQTTSPYNMQTVKTDNRRHTAVNTCKNDDSYKLHNENGERPTTSENTSCCNNPCREFTDTPNTNDRNENNHNDTFINFQSDKDDVKNAMNNRKICNISENANNGNINNTTIDKYSSNNYAKDIKTDDKTSTSNNISSCCNTSCNKFTDKLKTSEKNVTTNQDNNIICFPRHQNDDRDTNSSKKSCENNFKNLIRPNSKNDIFKNNDDVNNQCNNCDERGKVNNKIGSCCNTEPYKYIDKTNKNNACNDNFNTDQSDRNDGNEMDTSSYRKDSCCKLNNGRRRSYKNSDSSIIQSLKDTYIQRPKRKLDCNINCRNKQPINIDSRIAINKNNSIAIDNLSNNKNVNNYKSTISTSRKRSYTVDKSRNSKSDNGVSPRHNETQEISEPPKNSDEFLRLAVQEWLHDLPMFPNLGKEAKEDNDNKINNLIRNLHNILAQSDKPDYKQKLKNEIEKTLNLLPIWYPGAKRDQNDFQNDMVDRLQNKLNSIGPQTGHKTNTETNSNRKISKDTDTNIISGNTSNIIEIKNEILNWLQSIRLKRNNRDEISNNMQIVDFIIIHTSPLLNKPMNRNNQKLRLVTTIVNILKDLPITISCPSKRTLYVHKCADNLANRLLSIRANYYNRCKNTNTPTYSYCRNNVHKMPSSDDYHQKAIICSAVKKCFEDGNIDCHYLVIEETGLIIVDFIEMPDFEGEKRTNNEIVNLLVTSTNLSEAQAFGIAKSILRIVKSMVNEGRINTRCCHKFQQLNHVSVYTSVEESNSVNYPITSTPKKKQTKKDIPKLNPQEIQYMENLSNLIRAWMGTLPANFNATEEPDFKKTIIQNLASDIMDYVKLEQLAPPKRSDRKKYFDYFIRRWIWRLNTIEIEDAESQIQDLVSKIEEIPVPIMTTPQQGNRQAMANIKFREHESIHKPFLPKGSEILEDEISIWMNEQPSNIFFSKDRSTRNKKIHELAEVLASKLTNKHPTTEIKNEVKKWLHDIVKPENENEIVELTENLKDRVINLPQDATLATNLDIKLKYEEDKKNRMKDYIKSIENQSKNTNNTSKNETAEQEHTIKMFLSKYIERNYNIDDPLARRAFNRLLKTHLQKLDPPTRQEVYNQLGRSEYEKIFPPQHLIKELEYIKDISDWLKNLPIDASFNTLGNRDRIDFVNNLATSIRQIEDERDNDPNAMNFDIYMASIILEYLRLLPILPEYVNIHNNNFMTNQLLDKINTHRLTVLNKTKANESIDTTGVNTENIGDIIEEFIYINGDDIAQDEIKLEVWAIRLIREIKKFVQVTSRPSVLSKAYVYNKLTSVPIPGDESAELFRLELEYVKEISNWLKNLPLMPLNEEGQNERVRKICELAEKITEIEQKKSVSPSDNSINKEFEDYVAKWISELPLDKKSDIVLPILIKQLNKRVEKVKQGDVFSDLDFTQFNKTNENNSNDSKRNKSLSCKSCCYNSKKLQNASTSNLMIDVIEKWSNALPIKGENENASQNMKDDISRKLFQKVDKLNMNRRVFNDDLLYTEMLDDEIETILENIPQNSQLQNKREQLKNDIISSVIEAKNIIKEKSAGDTYKQKLETTIETSIPHPVNVHQIYDPGFEIYKNRLATMFILDNLDHGSDLVKLKYEKLLQKEIDKYFEHAKNKNAVPLSKDEIYNELYSALFKVPIPNEAAVIEEVEELKTRCEIDAWFEELPLKEADGLGELLEWDQILSTLAKKVYKIESTESNPDQKILKETMKWLTKLPIKPDRVNELENFAGKLQKALKSTARDRKCVLDDSKSTKCKKRKTKAKGKELVKKRKDQSKIVSPGAIISEHRSPRKKAADVIFETVQAWCDQLPVITNTRSEQNTQVIKDNLSTKILIKISELNSNPEIFNDDHYYNDLLNDELDRLLCTISTTCNFENSKAARKYQLIQAVKAIKPLILEEKANYIYKENLNRTVDAVLAKPRNISSEKDAVFVELRNDIIDDYAQYKYSKNDHENRQIHKANLHNTVSKFVNNIDKKDKDKINTLMKTNQLLSELAKVPATHQTNDRDEVEEIRMKNEIADLFDELGIYGKDIDKTKVNYLKLSLAKKLNEIEMKGYNPDNEAKMKNEITRCLNKLGKQVNPGIIDNFVTKLKNNEAVRRSPQVLNEDEQALNSCPEECGRVCFSRDLQTDFRAQNSFAPRNSPQRLTRTNNSRLTEIQTNEGSKNPSAISCRAYQPSSNSEEDLTSISSSEDESSKCACDTRKYCRERPVCMVPMKWMCKGSRRPYPFWCRMPLPGFF